MPSVSVVLPTYNRAALVVDAIDSVLRQTHSDLELIVVVDGSEDDTVSRLKRIADPRLRTIVQANAGLNAARNAALDLARGEFIALLDDDDVWRPEKLAMQVDLLRSHPDASFIFSEFTVWQPGVSERPGGLRRWFDQGWFELDETGQRMFTDARPQRAGDRHCPVWKGDLYHSLMVGALVLPSTAVFRNSALVPREHPFPENDFHCGDWAFFGGLARRAPALFMDYETTLNRSHVQTGRLTQARLSIRLGREAAMLQRIWGQDADFLDAHGPRYRKRLKAILLKLAKAHLREGNSAAARKSLDEAWRIPGRPSRDALLLGGVLSLPGLDRAVRLVDSTRNRLRDRASGETSR